MEYLSHTDRIVFPSPERANSWGMVAQGGNLSPGIVLSAYEQGIFPWYEEPPIIWFSPDPRFVLYLENFRISSRFRRTLRSPGVSITMDHAFDQVIRRCREKRLDSGGTWITEEMETGYRELHRLGFTHSVEVWRDGVLVGGLYGVSVGGLFAGESMFSDIGDGSKFALVALVGLMDELGLPMVDCQAYTDHLARFGAEEIPRNDFLAQLADLRQRDAIPPTWYDVDGDAMLARGVQLAGRNAEGRG